MICLGQSIIDCGRSIGEGGLYVLDFGRRGAQVECVIDLRRVSKQPSKVRHVPMRYSCIRVVQCGFVILNAEGIPVL